MSKKRRLSDAAQAFENVECSAQDNLFDALYKTGNSSSFPNAWDIFNKPFHIQPLLKSLGSQIDDLVEFFSEGTNFGFIDGYVHFDDVANLSDVPKSSAVRRYNTLEKDVKRTVESCKYHMGQQCNMVDQDVGFLLYISWLDLPSVEDEEDEQSHSDPVHLMEVEDDESAFQAEEEKNIADKFDAALFRAETITKVEDYTIVPTSEDSAVDALQCLPGFPTYHFNDRDYVLLCDIEYLFDLREDHCLALLARWGELDDGFVESTPCPLAVLDTQGDNFIEREDAALLCTQMFEEYEKQGLPTEEEFMDIQNRLGISEMGYESSRLTLDPSKIDESKSSTNLYTNYMLDLDEVPEIDIEDTDHFLGRAKGSRPVAMGKSQGLFHYIGKLNKETVAVFHGKYTESSQLPLLAFKALSRIVGSRPINKGADKIILLEKQEAIRVFGYMPGVVGSRAAYFATLGAYVLAHVGCAKDLLKLKDYKKQEYLRFRGRIDIEEGPSDKRITGEGV